MVKDILIKNFDYPLPDQRIAKFPLQCRDACKLLVAHASGNDPVIAHHHFSDLPALLSPGSILVCNETRVINARLDFRKPTGSRIEIFLLEPSNPADYAVSFASISSCRWSCLVGNLKRWKSGDLSKLLDIPGVDAPVALTARLLGEMPGKAREIEFSWDNPSVSFATIVEAAGNIPIPPYLNRPSQESDQSDYQTVFSRVQGSVAAPTAGLHFTDSLLDALEKNGIHKVPLVLHVGAGTFQPVKSDVIGEHPMHTESFSVTRPLLEALISAISDGRDIVAVGTTSVRTLESLPWLGHLIASGHKSHHVGQWLAYENPDDFDTIEALRTLLTEMDRLDADSLSASTAIMIAPGFNWRIVNRMVTNFHQPQSTLLLLVSSFLEDAHAIAPDAIPVWRRIYQEALDGDYRFLSYGDACLFSRP